jgi:hypothetical protein
MRIFAQQVLKEANDRRVVFDAHASKTEADRATKQSFLEQAVLQFVIDILGEFDLPTLPEISIGTLRGFEGHASSFNTKSGYIEVYASFKSMSQAVVRLELLIPIRQGVIYRPSIIKINGNKTVFSPLLIEAMIAHLETIRPVLSDMFSNHPNFVHVDNVERGLFQSPFSEFAQPVYDRYLVDEYRM